MKTSSFFLLSLICILSAGCNKAIPEMWTADYNLSVMSFNLRYDTEEDGSNRWSNRKEACLAMWRAHQPSVVGVQEGLYHQVHYLNDSLSDYAFVGVGRDDGYSAGEYAAIFYLKEQFELIETNSFWLSETPDFPSLGWDANNIRIATWVQLKDIETQTSIFVFNTHFDHKGKTARTESAKLLVQKIEEIADEGAPVFITGDFNAWISNAIFEPITDKYFSARRFASRTDNHKSFNAWGKWYVDWNLDYIFYQNANALSFQTIIDDYGVPFISDHYPIITHFDYSE